jgi:hypothetical protein
LQEVFDLVGNEYVFLDEYVSNHVKLRVIHSVCKREYSVSPANFISGNTRCKKCQKEKVSRGMLRPFEEVVAKLESNGFSYVECPAGYRNDKSKITVRCKNDHISTKSVVAVMHHLGCPKCKSSKGETRIYEVLTTLKVEFIEQYRFEDCRYKKPLPFDFCIKDKNGNIALLIEYDGEQHFIPYRTADGMKKLKEVQRNDRIKSDYCTKNEIPLLRIPYWDFDNIESLLTEKLLEQEVIIGVV